MDELTNSWLLDGKGGGRKLKWNELGALHADGSDRLWMHLNYSKPEVQEWMYEESGLSPLTVEALLQTETRPRCVVADEGLMIFLRGVNLNPGADPEDMVSLRLWIGEKKIFTLGLRHLLSLDDLRALISQGSGPESTGDFIVMLVELLLDRAGIVIEDLYDLVDQLEDSVLVASGHQQREQLAGIRRQAISLRRFLAPQREALNRLSSERSSILNDEHHLRLREAYDRLTRFVEDLDAARERAGVVHESLISSLTEQTNVRMYILAIISAIFLPLSFITGLLGINVGGIPGADSPFGFVIVIGAIVLMGGVLWAFFRWRRWF
ncbi:MAG: zinc transporter ZntB [Sedimenticola sp.]|nr:zinc transporter ZntB [Sedimenticola sp.]MCW8920661.1 zinc transporter ZntB [Sedimenticola sp.]MCW8947442.1 zinc transporter ZntB [Sedimenticola sp.]MCW8949957.1 zinc transporter ZntB [Sedimenticola sp.]MCW8976900.1 zinc transporter ZntB [Sedimenticola sp.]